MARFKNLVFVIILILESTFSIGQPNDQTKQPTNKKKSFSDQDSVIRYKAKVKTLSFGKFDSFDHDQQETVVDFHLEKNVKKNNLDFKFINFIENTLVLQEAAKPELDSLANCLNLNPSLQLRIFGHCNKKGKREVVYNQSNSDLFKLDSLHLSKRTLSANNLALKRANLIKTYLVKKGSSPNKIKIKSCGGDFPLFNENSSLSYLNDRIDFFISIMSKTVPIQTVEGIY